MLTVVQLIVAIGIVAAFIGDITVGLIVTTITIPVAILVTAFSALTVEVDEETVVLRYQWGWPRKTIKRSRVVSHRVVRNRWYHGLGLRWIPGGELWNVWGLDAVELAFGPDASDNYIAEPKRRRRFRIGTDDPDGLERALRM